jgi:hypothetical protein
VVAGARDVVANVVELAVIPARAVRLLQPQHRDVAVVGEAAHRPPEPVPDLLEQRRRRQREPEMVMQEPGHLPRHLQLGHVRVQIQPIHAVDLEGHMPIEHLVDVGHRRHARSLHARGRALPTRQPHRSDGRAGGRPGGGLPPLPLNVRTVCGARMTPSASRTATNRRLIAPNGLLPVRASRQLRRLRSHRRRACSHVRFSNHAARSTASAHEKLDCDRSTSLPLHGAISVR